MEQRTLKTLVHNYISAWNEPDPAARRAFLEAAWASNGEYTDPMSQASNRDELDGVISGFLANNPGAQFTVQGDINHHHRFVRFHWTLQFAAGREMTGMDFGELSPDGKLAKIVGFF